MDGYGAPFYYDYQNAITSMVSPNTVHCKNTALANYFARYLLQKAMSVFEFRFPETWAENYLLYVLYCWGRFAIFNTDRFGVVALDCGLTGYNLFYQPTNAVITNPLIRSTITPKIDSQCVVVKLQPNYCGIMDIVSYYADLMALCAEAAGMNLVNSKLSYVFAAENKQSAESYKKACDKIYGGDPAVFMDSKLFDSEGKAKWQMFNQNVGQNYIVDRVLADMRKIEQMFATDIGIPNANTDKKERLIVDEVNSNNFETQSRCDMWLMSMQKEFEKANKMFGLDLSVDWRNIERGASIGTGDVINHGTV